MFATMLATTRGYVFRRFVAFDLLPGHPPPSSGNGQSGTSFEVT
jgi:hypothetical protein